MSMRIHRGVSRVGLLCLFTGACASEVKDPGADASTEGSETAGPDGDEGDVSDDNDDDDGGDADDGSGALFSCLYTSPFTNATECREYTGSGWTDADVQSACDQLSGDVSADACSSLNVLGRCVLEGGEPTEVQIVAYGVNDDTCANQQMGCEVFGGGEWQPTEICEGAGGDGGDVEEPFIQPTRACVDPLPGEAPGNGPDGQVCTWQAISGSTEEGRDFRDYASCDVVYTQRPYYGAPPNDADPEDDDRLDDPEFVAELEWVRSQIAASACVCCHADTAPLGPANWSIDAPGNWTRTFYDSGLALGANWIDSTPLGMYAPEDNNGFDRSLGMPSTDPARMVAFFQEELSRRDLDDDDFEDYEPFGGPLYQQLVYEPEPCENGEGVEIDGTIRWEGGTARYVHILEAGSANPTIPPNLDLPEGSLWRVDVPHTGDPVESGDVVYGEVPTGTSQRFPQTSAPTELELGGSYLLYVSKDVAQPITRCLFTFD